MSVTNVSDAELCLSVTLSLRDETLSRFLIISEHNLSELFDVHSALKIEIL